MSTKFGRKYEMTIYPPEFIQTSAPGNTFVDSLKTQATQVSALLNQIQTLTGVNVSALAGILTQIQSQMTQVISLVQSLQGILGIPASVISGLERNISQQVAGLISSIEGSTVIPIPFLNNFKNNALNQINSLTTYIPNVPASFTSFTSFNSGSSLEPVVIKNPFTLVFNIRREALASANTASFQIYNLAESTRNQIYKDKLNTNNHRRITLRAGYSYPLPIVFDGNIRECTSCRVQGQTNFVTEIEAYDYAFAMVQAHTSKTWLGQVTKQDVIKQYVNDLISAGPSGAQISAGYIHKYDDIQYNRSVSDFSWSSLTNEVQSANFVDNGLLHILEDDDCFVGAFPQISSENGLLGVPKRSGVQVAVEMLFEPTLLVGQIVSLLTTSQALFNGNYKIIKLNHFGVMSDAIGGKCQSNVGLFNFQKSKQIIGATGT